MRIVNFKKFNEAKEVITYLTVDEIKDIFVDIFDEGYGVEFFEENQKIGRYFFEFTKKLSLDRLELAKDHSGYNGIDYIKKEFDIVSMFNDPKNRLESMGYLISFEFDFTIISTSPNNNTLIIVCHLHHKDSPRDEEDGVEGIDQFLTPEDPDDYYDYEDEEVEASEADEEVEASEADEEVEDEDIQEF